MKKFLFLVICAFSFWASTNLSVSRPADYITSNDCGTTMIWCANASTDRAGWVSLGGDWPVGSFQCSEPQGSQCNLWDWKREFSNLIVSNPSDPVQSRSEIATYFATHCPEVLNPWYGINSTILKAAGSGIILTVPASADPEMYCYYSASGINYSFVW